MELTRLKQLRRKKLAFDLLTILLTVGVILLAGYIGYLSLVILYVAAVVFLRVILFWRLKEENILHVLSPEMKELRTYERSVFNTQRPPYDRVGMILEVVIGVFLTVIAATYFVWEGSSAKHHLSQNGYTFIFGLVVIAVITRLVAWNLGNKKLERAAGQKRQL